MKTILEILNLAADHLEQKGVDQPRRQAEEVIADALEIKRLDLYLRFDQPVSEDELQRLRQVVSRRAEREPPAYISGRVEFADCLIEVNSDVLIPRPETEILIQQIELHDGVLWDICTGSGCIAIALKKRFPSLEVFASDISIEALSVAEKNSQTNGVDITFLQGDLLAPFAGKKADFIICNPPYISEEEYEALDPEVKREPRGALVGGVDGLEYYRRLAADLPIYLNPKGRVWFEIGFNQGEKVKEIFSGSCWKNVHFSSDWSGHDRFFSLEFE